MEIADTIREMRMKAGLTQELLARKTGTKRITIGQYECEDKVPSIQMFNRICMACGYKLTVKKLQRGEED